MKITVTHSTLYRYDFPVYLEPHIFRLQPRMSATQRLLAFDYVLIGESLNLPLWVDDAG